MKPQDGHPDPSPAASSKMRNVSKTWGITTISDLTRSNVKMHSMYMFNRFQSPQEHKSMNINLFFVTFFETDVTVRRQNDRYDHEKSGPRADPNSTKIIRDLYDSGTKTVHKSCVDNASVASVDKAKSIKIHWVL